MRRSALRELQGYQLIWAVLFIGFATVSLSEEAQLSDRDTVLVFRIWMLGREIATDSFPWPTSSDQPGDFTGVANKH